jgi:hypothetical protein
VDTGVFKSHLLIHWDPLVALFNLIKAFFSVEDISAKLEAETKRSVT